MKRIATLVFILLLTVCFTATAQTILRMSTLFHSGDAQAMERIVERFNEEHTDVQIDLSQGQWAEYYAQLYNSVVAGNAPHIGIVHTTKLPEMQPALTPLTNSSAGNLLEAAGISAGDYIENLWTAGAMEGEQYLIPLDTHMFGLWYNRSIFREAGLDPDSPPQTRQEFEDAANAIIENTDAYAFHPAEDSLPRKLRRAWFYLFWQQGGELFDANYTEATFNNDQGMAACEYLVGMVHENGWNTPTGNGFNQFAAGELGMLVAGNWYYWTASESELDFGFAKLPVFFDELQTWGNSHNLVIPLQAADTSDEVLIAAAQAIRWINENSDIWGIYGGHIPAHNAARQSPALIESDTWQVSLGTFSEMAEAGAVHYPITHQNAAQLEDAITPYIEQAYLGDLTCEQALDQAESEANSVLQ